ncbi:ADP-ribosylation factor GTPase-activating protein effector protein 2 [Monosporozyma servazzii]
MTSVPVKKALNALLRDQGNLTCADCKTQQHPRWASWSLGVFICIKCAGIHRSLGTHISKVKSVDLDTWKEEHLNALIKSGNNKRANEYYENKLNQDPESQNKLQKMLMDTNKLSSFIKNKYEYKKWCGDAPVVREVQKKESGSNVDLLNNSVISQDNNNTRLKSANVEPQLVHLNKGSTQSQPNINNTVSQPNVNSDRPDLKKSILSLYSKPSASSPILASNMSSRNSSNSSSTPSASQANLAFNNSNMGMSMNMYTANSNTNLPQNNSTISLDDNELFKNVWQ